MSFSVALIGRPNVGKSTLFNRLVGRHLALVDDQPGVTRDLREGEARLMGLSFRVIDTAGLERAKPESMAGRMRAFSQRAIESADVCLFMVDGRAGLLPDDYLFADMLRKSAARVILVVNKCESRAAQDGLYDAYSLGMGEPVALSAEHAQGLTDLFDRLVEVGKAVGEDMTIGAEDDLRAEGFEYEPLVDLDIEEGDDETPLAEVIAADTRPRQIAIMGRPNAGKSTLLNKILGEDRVLTGPEAGLTRDAISVQCDWNGQAFRIWDTAGLRKRAKVNEKLERLANADGLRAVKFSETVILLLDAERGFEQQDIRLAALAEREGRGIVIAVNKWDLQKDKAAQLRYLQEECTRLLPQIRGVPVVAISAKTGKGLDALHKAVARVYEIWNKRISTARLNNWLGVVLQNHPPPAPQGKRIRLRYMTQVKTRPPGFVVMCSHPDALATDYRRYLVNGLRRDMGMECVPVRLFVRSQSDKNPYKNKKVRHGTKLDKHQDKRIKARRRGD